MKRTHLASAGVALLLLIASLAGGFAYARTVEDRAVHALAPQLLVLNSQGSALQQAAFRQSDLLPVYGSSELITLAEHYGAVPTFRTYPTGFAPYQVAEAGVTSLVMAQAIATVGPEVRGHKVVISFTPSMFTAKMIKTNEYGWLFSPLHAYGLLFNPQLSLETKHRAAHRMLNYPATLFKDPVLRFAAKHLAGDSLLDQALYVLACPLGLAQTLVLTVQDHAETLSMIGALSNPGATVPRTPARIDWHALKARAAREQMQTANNNPYGFDNVVWRTYFQGRHVPLPAASGDMAYQYNLDTSVEWIDLDLLLRVLTELGARPLLLSRPVNGAYWEAMGVSQDARDTYYKHLRSLAQQYGVPVIDFKAHEMDRFFSIDTLSHTSRKGWVYVNETLDAFYHDRLPALAPAVAAVAR